MCLACQEIDAMAREILQEVLREERMWNLLDEWSTYAWAQGFNQKLDEKYAREGSK